MVSFRCDGKMRLVSLEPNLLRDEDRWILAACAKTVRDVNGHFKSRELHSACKAIRKFMYTNICDNYLVRDSLKKKLYSTFENISHSTSNRSLASLPCTTFRRRNFASSTLCCIAV